MTFQAWKMVFLNSMTFQDQWSPCITHTHTHPFYGPLDCSGLPSEPVPEPIWILLKQETVSGSGISWAICKSAPCSRQITTPAAHHSDFYRPNALPAAQQHPSTKGSDSSNNANNSLHDNECSRKWALIIQVADKVI